MIYGVEAGELLGQHWGMWSRKRDLAVLVLKNREKQQTSSVQEAEERGGSSEEQGFKEAIQFIFNRLIQII